jgi:hypothetical protein
MASQRVCRGEIRAYGGADRGEGMVTALFQGAIDAHQDGLAVGTALSANKGGNRIKGGSEEALSWASLHL